MCQHHSVPFWLNQSFSYFLSISVPLSACAARLKEQLSALQQESDEEQRVSRREVMRLRDLLREACLDRDESRGEVQRLGEALEVATTSKVPRPTTFHPSATHSLYVRVYPPFVY